MHMPVAVIPLSLWFFAFLPVLVVGVVSMIALVGTSVYLLLTPHGPAGRGSAPLPVPSPAPAATRDETPRAA